MKPYETKQTFETFGADNLKEQTFRIKQSKEAFKILSSGLYSDKILAVVRELSANAWDSHRMAGKANIPFTVHLPNQFEPYFSVRDYGVGLSEKEVLNLYTTYFDSTKRTSNDATGMLGLGSKSPFSYTDQFTVTSIYNGVQYVFSCFISEEGVPSVSKLSEKKLSNKVSNGLEVHMAVQENDFNAFRNKATDVFRYYEVKPEIVGQSIDFDNDYELEYSHTLKSGVTVKRYARDNHYGRSVTYNGGVIIQGACAYPIELSQLTNNQYGTIYSVLEDYTIDVPIGNISITASRESIEYDKPTVAFLKRIAEELLDELCKEHIKTLSSIDLHWDVFIKAVEIQHQSRVISKHLNSKIVWKGKTFDEVLDNVTLDFSTPDTDEHGVKRSKPYASLQYATKQDINYYKNFTLNKSFTDYKQSIRPEKNIVFVVDMEKAHRFKHILTYNYGQGSDNVPNTLYFVRPFEGKAEKVWKQVNKICKGATIVKLQDLPEPPKELTSDGKVKIKKKLKIRNSWGWDDTSDDVELSDGGLYVDLVRNTVKDYHSNSNYGTLIADAKKLGVLDEDVTIYGIPASYKNIPNQHSGWTNVHDLIANNIKKKIKGKNIKKLQKEDYRRKFMRDIGYDVGRILRAYKDVDKDIKKIYDLKHKYSSMDKDETLKLVELLNKVEHNQATDDTAKQRAKEYLAATDPIRNKIEALKEKYPLLFEYGGGRYEAEDMFIQYINDVNTLQKLNS
jgi:hypothetical protein